MPPTLFNTAFWLWMNQTYKVHTNYGKPKDFNGVSRKGFFKGYLATTLISISVAVLCRNMTSKWTMTSAGGIFFIFNALTAFLAASIADFFNPILMRN